MGATGHLKVPQVGRVIIQDDVEIGAGTTIDRGAIRDTMIGEGTKIDNLVQIGHNVVIGRRLRAGRSNRDFRKLHFEDFVALGARVGVTNHVTIGEGAQIAAISIVGATFRRAHVGAEPGQAGQTVVAGAEDAGAYGRESS